MIGTVPDHWFILRLDGEVKDPLLHLTSMNGFIFYTGIPYEVYVL